MINKRKESKSSIATGIRSWAEQLPFIGKRINRAPDSDSKVAELIDVFAAFTYLDQYVTAAEIEIALDLLRHAYPDIDHGWLSRRFQRALKNRPSLKEISKKMAADFSKEDIHSLALQLYLLITASLERKQSYDLFVDFLSDIANRALAESILQEMRGEIPNYFPIDTLSFGKNSDIPIPTLSTHIDEDKQLAFKLYQAGNVLLVRNTGTQTLSLSSQSLLPGSTIRIRSHQQIFVEHFAIGTKSIEFLFRSKYDDTESAIYLTKKDSVFIAEKNKNRHTIFKVNFGLHVIVTVLRDTDLSIGTHQSLKRGDVKTVEWYDRIEDPSGTFVQMDQLRKQTLSSGSRYKLNTKNHEYLISNNSKNLSKNDLYLNSALTENILLKVSFDQEQATGTLEIIESGRVSIICDERAVSQSCTIQDGSLIRLGNEHGIRCRISDGFIEEEKTIIQRLQVHDISHTFHTSQKALDNIAFTVERGETLCIMGPSGSGKSTLLSVLSGQLKPERGHVRLNDISLYQQQKRLVPFITHMQQEEALNPHLTVREHLYHATSIRLPYLDKKQKHHRVNATLDELSLQTLSNRYVGKPGGKSLSGGERSRLNLGLDIGSDAEILLFDEPISGLSSKDSEYVAETLRSLSNDKIVIASLHRPGERVLQQFDKILLLDQSGRVAFFGSPLSMMNYFNDAAVELGLTHLQLDEQITSLEPGADFVFDVLEAPLHDNISQTSFVSKRRFPPHFWQERFENNNILSNVEHGDIPAQTNLGDIPKAQDNMPIPQPRKQQLADQWQLFCTHFKRSFLTKYRDRGTIYSTLLETPVLALLISLTLRASENSAYSFHSGLNIIHFLFLAATVGMFLGLTNSATEILRDYPVLRRERNIAFRPHLYITSKFLCLSLLGIIQSAIYIAIGHAMLEIHCMFLYHWMWMSLTAVCGTALALLISNIMKSERAALSAIPLILVPQLLLAGALIPFSDMNRGLFEGADVGRSNGNEPAPARFIPLRYAYEGMIVTQAEKNYFEKQHARIQDHLEKLKALDFNISPQEKERIEILKLGLTRLVAAEALDMKSAKTKIHAITHAAIHGSIEKLESISVYEENLDEAPSCRSYFINDRLDLLYRDAESKRTDYRIKEKRNIFYASKKYLWRNDGQKINTTEETNKSFSTITYCVAIIFIFILLCQLLTTYTMMLWKRRTNGK